VTVGVTNAVGLLGALQFNIVFTGESGGFAGAFGTAALSLAHPERACELQ
jgi:hypothetical protein